MAKKHLGTLTASSSSSLEFTSGITSSYQALEFYLLNLHPSTDAVYLYFALSTDGGSNYNVNMNTAFSELKHDENDTSGGGLSTGTFTYNTSLDVSSSRPAYLSPLIGADNDQSVNGKLSLYIPSDTTYAPSWTCETSTAAYTDYIHQCFVNASCSAGSAINAVKFYMSGGNIDSGKIKLFGVS
ncbi:MAG: hypothetical protein VW683_05370 [Betaproteobacteria bacterium]